MEKKLFIRILVGAGVAAAALTAGSVTAPVTHAAPSIQHLEYSSDWKEGYIYADSQYPFTRRALAPSLCSVKADLNGLSGTASKDFQAGCIARFDNVQVPGGVWTW